MQKARIRTGWKNKAREVSLTDLANALSAICWRVALNAAKNLHDKEFDYTSDAQRIGVMEEYLYFFIHCADRLMHPSLEQQQRTEFLTSLALDCRRHYRENLQALFGRESDADHFIPALNAVAGELSTMQFDDQQPGFEMFRALGSRIQAIMGDSQTNRWVQNQIMEVDGPDAWDIFSVSFAKLRRNSGLSAEREISRQ